MKKFLFGLIPFLFVSCIYSPEANYKSIFEKKTYDAFYALENPLVMEMDTKCFFDFLGNEKLGKKTYCVGTVFVIYDTQKDEVFDFVYHNGDNASLNHVLPFSKDAEGKNVYYSFATFDKEIRTMKPDENEINLAANGDNAKKSFIFSNIYANKVYLYQYEGNLSCLNAETNEITQIDNKGIVFETLIPDEHGNWWGCELINDENNSDTVLNIYKINFESNTVENTDLNYKVEPGKSEFCYSGAYLKFVDEENIYIALEKHTDDAQNFNDVGILIINKNDGNQKKIIFDDLKAGEISDVIKIEDYFYCLYSCKNETENKEKMIFGFDVSTGEKTDFLAKIDLNEFGEGYQAVRKDKIYFVENMYEGGLRICHFDTSTNQLSDKTVITLESFIN